MENSCGSGSYNGQGLKDGQQTQHKFKHSSKTNISSQGKRKTFQHKNRTFFINLTLVFFVNENNLHNNKSKLFFF